MPSNYAKKMLTACVTAGGLAFACASYAANTPVKFQLNWYGGGYHAGFAVAVEKGYYNDAGLDVSIIQGNGSGTTAQMVASGQAQLAYADAVAVSQMIAKGAPMKIVATMYQSNPNEVEALKKTGIKSIADLKGKRIGIAAGSSQAAMLPLFYAANNLNPSELTELNMPATSMAPSLLQGQVDAILGSADDFGVQLEAQGAQLDKFRFADHGVPTVSTSVFARDSFIKDHPDVLRKFIAASLKGWAYALDNQADAIADLKKVFPDMDTKLATGQLAAIPGLFCSGGTQYLGKSTDAHWAQTQELLSKVKLLPPNVDPKTYYTYDYLPPESELTPCKYK